MDMDDFVGGQVLVYSFFCHIHLETRDLMWGDDDLAVQLNARILRLPQ